MKNTAGAEAAGMRSYALQQTRTLVRRLAFQMGQTAGLGDAGSVHDLRVAIRRFTECLRVFRQFFPGREAKRIRHKLEEINELAAVVRDRDITAELLGRAGMPPRSKLPAALQQGRKQAVRDLLSAIRRSSRDNFSRKWRTKLGL